MDQTASNLTEKIHQLRFEQLRQVERFVESLEAQGPGDDVTASLSEPAFASIWNNPEDDAYDAL